MDGHNGRRFDRDIRMKTPCRKAKRKTVVCKTKKQKAGQRCKARAKARARRS